MKSLQLSGILLAAFFLVGCVQSVQPFVKESQAIYDSSLIGTWENDEGTTVIVTGSEADRKYAAVVTDKDQKTGHFEMRLAKVQDRLLLDITVGNEELEKPSD